MRKTETETDKTGQAAPAAIAAADAEQPQLPFFDAVMPPTMTTENSSPHDAPPAPASVDLHNRANGMGAESNQSEAATERAAPAEPSEVEAAAPAHAVSAEPAATERIAATPQAPPDDDHAIERAALDAGAPAEAAPDEATADAAACADENAGAVGERTGPATAAVGESLGQRLRAAREARGIALEDAAHRMKLPLSTVQALEADRYERIGEGIYLRSYLTKYLRLLDLPLVLAERVLVQNVEPPPLVTSGTISRPRYLYERYSSSALYLILTAVIIVPAVWLAMRAGFDGSNVQITPLDGAEPAASLVAGKSSGVAPTTPAAAPVAEHAKDEAPLVASLAPFPPIKHDDVAEAPERAAQAKPVPVAPAPDGSHTLRLTVPEASWVEIVAADGEKLEYGLLPAGSTRTYHSAKAVDVRVGNANGATFEVDGKAQDLAPFRHSNVAHFRLGGGDSAISHSGG